MTDTNTHLIVGDSLFVLVAGMVYATTDDIRNTPVILKILIVIAFASCIVRHINYYKIHRRIY